MKMGHTNGVEAIWNSLACKSLGSRLAVSGSLEDQELQGTYNHGLLEHKECPGWRRVEDQESVSLFFLMQGVGKSKQAVHKRHRRGNHKAGPDRVSRRRVAVLAGATHQYPSSLARLTTS